MPLYLSAVKAERCGCFYHMFKLKKQLFNNSTDMKRLKAKSRSGVSILIGLLVFVVCACVALAIISGASASSGRLSEYREQENAYLVTKSTAKDITKLLKGRTFVLDKQSDGSYAITLRSSNDTETDTVNADKGIIPLVSTALKEVARTGSDYDREFDIDYIFGSENPSCYKTEGELIITSDYDITISLNTFMPEGSDESYALKSAYSTTLNFKLAKKDIKRDESDNITQIYVYYGGVTVNSGGNAS